jgi:hypothetical protein
MAKRRTVRAAKISLECGIDLSRLAGWINKYAAFEASVPRAVMLRDDASAVAVAELCGIFRHAGLAECVTCTECEDAHASKIVRDCDGHYSHFCLFSGQIYIAEDEVSLLRFDRSALLVALTAAADIARRGTRPFANGKLALLGIVPASHESRSWVLGYADQLEDQNVLAGVTDALAKQFPDGPGLIITPSPVNLNVPLPRGYRLAGFGDLLFGTTEGIALNWGNAEILLGHRKSAPGQPGRPSERDTIKQLWLAARTSADWPPQQNEQARLILSRWPGHGRPPAVRTIENHLRVLERQARSMVIADQPIG